MRVSGRLPGLVLVAVLGFTASCVDEPRTRRPSVINNTPSGPLDPPGMTTSGPAGAMDGGADVNGTFPATDGPAADPGACSKVTGPGKSAGESCLCDVECATGFCQEGSCCSGSTCGRRALGAPCQRLDQCESGNCSDGVCCNVACDGSCVSCNQPDRTGECVPVPAGQKDPRDGCRKEAQETCGLSGFCNGQAGCAKYAPGTTCGSASCSGPRTFVPAGECDGDGVCVKGTALECTPFTCEAASCRSSCVMDADCVPPNVCSDGRCGLRGQGQACSAGNECQTGFCVDGVCCENACTGRCQFCASPSSRGSCTPVRAGAPDPRAAAGLTDPALICVDQGVATCGTNGRCDGQGSCQRYENGATCRAGRCDSGPNAETGPSVCMNGSCRTPAAVGCAPFRGCTGTRCISQCGSDSQCATGFFCIDGTCGKRPNGGLCSRDADCESEVCAQGRCCSSDCDDACVACNLPGSLGTCSPVRAGTEDDECGDPRCSACDGRGRCTVSAGTTCGTPTCGGGGNRNAVLTPTCNADAECVPVPRTCPTGEICRAASCACPPGQDRCPTGCKTLETDPTNCGDCGTTCAPGASCVDGQCTPPPCPAGEIRCGDTCIDPLSNTSHCGRCDNNCLATPPNIFCREGTCSLLLL